MQCSNPVTQPLWIPTLNIKISKNEEEDASKNIYIYVIYINKSLQF
jgi:hypothetical protein